MYQKKYLLTEQEMRDIFRRGANIDHGESMVKLEQAVIDCYVSNMDDRKEAIFITGELSRGLAGAVASRMLECKTDDRGYYAQMLDDLSDAYQFWANDGQEWSDE